MTLKNQLTNAIEVLTYLGYTPSKEIRIMEDNEMKSMGQCYDRGNYFMIKINTSDGEDTTGTVMHEVIHTVKGCFNHAKKFTKIAYEAQATGMFPMRSVINGI